MQRIEQLLAARPQHDLAEPARDPGRSAVAGDGPPAAVHPAGASRAIRSPRRRRRSWPRSTARWPAIRPAPLIFWSWARHLTEGVFADDLGGPAAWRGALGGRSYRDALEGVLERNDARWCDDQSTAALVETCAQQIDSAFTKALDELQAAQGSDVAAWRWDRAHIARSEHRPFSRVKLLARWFELRAPVGGDTYTVNVSRVNLRPDPTTQELYLDEHGPSLRALYDLGDPAQSRVMHSTGQSGNPFSAQYRRLRRAVDARRVRAAVERADGRHAATPAGSLTGSQRRGGLQPPPALSAVQLRPTRTAPSAQRCTSTTAPRERRA